METYEYVIWIWTFYAMSLPLRSRKVMAAIHPDRAREACGSPWPAGTGTPLLKIKTAYMPLKSVGDIPTSFLKKREK